MLTDLAGLKFRPKAIKQMVAEIKQDQQFALVRDSENAFDSNAIKIMDDNLFLGFVQAYVAREIAPLMDNGAEFTCIATGNRNAADEPEFRLDRVN